MRRAVAAWGLKLCAAEPRWQSDTVSAIHLPDGFDSNAFVRHAYQAYGLSLGVGLSKVAGRVFRIGHLGDFNDLTLMGTLAGVEMGLGLARVPHEPGGVSAAMSSLAHDTHAAPPVSETNRAAALA